MLKRFTSVLLTITVLLSLLVIPGIAAELPTSVKEGDIVILHTNDVHGGIDGYAKIAALKQAYQDAGAYVLLVDAGDFAQGGVAVNMYKGETAIELMNMAGYDAVALGNHEFDYNFTSLPQLFEPAKFPILAANVFYEGKLAFQDNVTFTTPDGVKIGVFGLDTPQAKTKSKPTNTIGVEILSDEALFQCAQQQVDALKAQNCDLIVCLSHLGTGDDAKGNRSIDMLEKVTGIDVLIDGHSHTSLEQLREQLGGTNLVGDTVLTSVGTQMEYIGIVTISGETITASAVPAKDITVSDPAIQARADEINKEVNAIYDTVIGSSEQGVPATGKGTQESPIGNLIADAMLWKMDQLGLDADAAIINAGGIRTGLPKGELTKRSVYDVLSLDWTMTFVQVTGAQLLEALESGTFSTPLNAGGFPQVAGMEYTINIGVPYDKGDLYPGGSTFYAPASIRRVSIQSVGGKPFDVNATYTIAANSHIAAGGATYYVFTQAAKNEDTKIPLDQLVCEYIAEELGGTITAEQYSKTEGRITIIDQAPISYTDVAQDDWFYDAVVYATEQGLMSGTGANSFSPNQPLQRGMLAQILYSLEGKPACEAKETFSDVAPDAWYAQAVSFMTSNGIVSGYGDGRFGPNDPITREQMAAILYQYAKFKGQDVSASADLSGYGDAAEISSYAQQAMQWANAEQLISGTGNNTLAPKGITTRCQAAAILMQFTKDAA